MVYFRQFILVDSHVATMVLVGWVGPAPIKVHTAY